LTNRIPAAGAPLAPVVEAPAKDADVNEVKEVDVAGAARPASGVAGKRMESKPKAWSARTHGFATNEHG
jgi:hypothetical protein